MKRLLPLLLLLALPGPLRAQEACPDGRITHILVDNHSIFDLEKLKDEPFSWAYGLANRLHMQTNERFLQHELLFSAGDCFDPFRLQDSERLLRRYPFISSADVYGVRQPDGNWHVVVDTQDEWTTVVEVRGAIDRGFEFRGAELSEKNFLGRGMLLSAFYRQIDATRLAGGRIFTPRLFNTRLDGTLTGARTRIGGFVQEELFWPFVGEVGRYAARQLYRHKKDYFTYSATSQGRVEHLLLPTEEERFEVTFAARVGSPGNLTVFGLGLSRDRIRFPGFPVAVEHALDNDFSALEPAPQDMTARLAGQTLYESGTRVSLLLGQRNVRWVRRRGLDPLRGIQDVEIGTDLGLTLGRTMGVLTTDGQPEDLYARLKVYAAAAAGSWVVISNVGVEGRRIFSGSASPEGWRDVVGQADALLYWQPTRRHTLFARFSGAGGWEMDQPFQLTLGGATGVRGYHNERFPGGRRIVLSTEERMFLGWPFRELFDLGATVFADAGRVWAGDAPFGLDSGWRGAAGAGLRVGFPAGSRAVIRLDVAFPVGNGARGSGAIFRLSVGDLLGLAAGFEKRQLVRSQRITVGPDHFNPTH